MSEDVPNNGALSNHDSHNSKDLEAISGRADNHANKRRRLNSIDRPNRQKKPN